MATWGLVSWWIRTGLTTDLDSLDQKWAIRMKKKSVFRHILNLYAPDVKNIRSGRQMCAYKNLICILQLKRFFHFCTKHFFNGAVQNYSNGLQEIELGNGLLDNTNFEHIISRFVFLPKTRAHDKRWVFQINVTYSYIEIISLIPGEIR